MVLEIIMNIIVIGVVIWHTYKLQKHMDKLDDHIKLLEEEMESRK